MFTQQCQGQLGEDSKPCRSQKGSAVTPLSWKCRIQQLVGPQAQGTLWTLHFSGAPYAFL